MNPQPENGFVTGSAQNVALNRDNDVELTPSCVAVVLFAVGTSLRVSPTRFT